MENVIELMVAKCVRFRGYMENKLDVVLELTIDNFKIVSEANNTDHWTKKRKRKKIHIAKMIELRYMINRITFNSPIVKLTRVSPRLLDDDNLVYAFKYIRDHIADMIYPGLAPGRADDKNILFVYDQKQASKTHALRVQISNMKESDD